MKTISSQGTLKHKPQRTCIACRTVSEKREVIRLVRTAEGIVEVDAKGKKPGRGAYLCSNLNCWEEGLKGNRLDRSLKTEISRENKTKLLTWIKEYLQNRETMDE